MKFASWLAPFLLVLLAVAALAGDPTRSAHDFSFMAIDEDSQIDLKAYQGKTVLVVNTASFCGFTHQYEGLQSVWQTYKDKGLVVLGVPSNDFGAQEPKAEAEIKSFCQGAFNVNFPLTKKYPVRGDKAHPFYRWVSQTTGGQADPRWNFHKLLVGPDGQLLTWFASSAAPTSAAVVRAIEQSLAQAEG